METQVPQDFRVFVVGPYDSQVVLDHTILSKCYDDFRRRWIAKLRHDKTASYARDRVTTSGMKRWLNGTLKPESAIEFLDSGGRTARDPSLVRVDLAGEEFRLDARLSPETAALFAQPPVLTDFRLKLHEYGIGIYSGWVEMSLTESIAVSQVDELIQTIRDAITSSPTLKARIRDIDDHMLKTSAATRTEMKMAEPVFAFEDVSTDHMVCEPRWIHTVSLFDVADICDGQPPFGDDTGKLVTVSHPDGLIDMSSGAPGFFHLGWGNSVGCNSGEALEHIVDALCRLECDWRAIDQFNRLLSKKLLDFADLSTRGAHTQVRSGKLIDQMKIELELYESDLANHLHTMAPHMHVIYRNGEVSWRMPDMHRDYRQKLSALDVLRQQVLTGIETRASNRFNALIGLITCFAVTSAAVDFLQFAEFRLSQLTRVGIVSSVLIIALAVFWPIVRPLIRHDR